MTATTRSFARMHRMTCPVCGVDFEQLGRRGRLQLTCSQVCRNERERIRRVDNRRERYQALVAAGAFPAVAQAGSQGPIVFAATLKALAEGDPAPLGISRPERYKPTGRLREIAKAPPAAPFNSWARRSA